MNSFSERDSKSERVGIASPLALTLCALLLIMTVFEAIKQSAFPNIPSWSSHILSIIFSSLIASGATYFNLKRYRSLIKTAHDEKSLIISLLNSTLESTVDGIFVTDRSGNISKRNNKADQLWSLPETMRKSNNAKELLIYIIEQLKDPQLFSSRINTLLANPGLESFDTVELKDGRIFELRSIPQKIEDEIIGRVWSSRDITESKRVEKTLQESEKKYEDLFEKSDDANLLINNGNFVDCNQAAVKMLRFTSKQEVLGAHPSVLSPEFQPDGKASAEKANEMMHIALKKGSHRFDWYHKRADGEVFPVEVLLTAIDANPDNFTLYTVWRDISDHKRAEEALKHEHILLRTVIDNLPDAIYAKDTECRKTLTNKTDLQNMGCEKEEDAIGKTDFDFFPPKVAEIFYNDDQKIIREGQPVFNREEFFFDKNGNKNWLLTSKLPLRDENGNTIGLIGIGHNITNRKKSELIHEAVYQISEAAHGVSDLYSLYKIIHEVVSTLMSATNFYIALYDEKADLLTFPYMVDEFDPPYEPKKPGKGLTEYILRKGEAFLIDMDKDLELRATGEAELVGTPSEIWLGVPLKVGGKTIGVIVVQDYKDPKAYGEDELQLLIFVSEQIAQVIERKKREEEIKQYTEALRQSNQTKDKLFSIIAHDLRSPFHPILSLAEILSTDTETLEREEIKLFSSEIFNAANSAFALMENLLEWSRMQSGTILFNPTTIELKQKADEVIHHLEENAAQKNITVKDDIGASLNVNADAQMIRSLFHNLISNAIKFTPAYGKITVRAAMEDHAVKVSVSDTGVGISADRMKKMFTVDKNISTKGTNQEKGTGLGLLLCKEFVEKHGGRIWIESEVNKGSTFIFTIPTAQQISG